MKVIITNGQATVADIEVLAAVAPTHDCNIIYADLDAAQKVTYDEGMSVIVQDSICNIDNTPYELDMQRMTSAPINEGVDEITVSNIDYLALSASDQGKLDAFNQLLIDKCW